MTRAEDRLFLVGARPRGDKVEAAPIGRILTALGLQAFPDSGSEVPLDDLAASVIAVRYAEEDTLDDLGDEPASRCDPEEAPEPCFLHLQPPGTAPRQLSFSALATFGRCPRRFYLQRVLGLGYGAGPANGDGTPDADSPEESLLDDVESFAGREVGLLVHALLERAELDGPTPTAEALRDQAAAAATQVVPGLSDEGIQRAAQLVAAFWDSPLACHPELGSALREEPFFFVHGEVGIHGVMDVLMQSDTQWRIVDYKSNSLAGREAREVAEAYRLQADLYCLAALKAGAPAVSMSFLFLERPEEPVVLECRAGDRELLEARLDAILRGIRESNFPAHMGGGCATCGVESFCRAIDRA
jgi:ATP-dependent exoDNAse (exonuclease V) beta subunit